VYFYYYSPEEFEAAMRQAAHIADGATRHAMREYSRGNVVDEDDLTGQLTGELNSALRGNVRGFRWNTKIFRHRRGIAAEEKTIGADLLIHVSIRSKGRSYSKGVLIQAKKVEPDQLMSNDKYKILYDQCGKMLSHSPSSFVFDYSRKGIRVGSATRIQGMTGRELYGECTMTPFRFFYDLFMCPIGDPKIRGTDIKSLPNPDFASIPHMLDIQAQPIEVSDV
jgi:hypothetical protein